MTTVTTNTVLDHTSDVAFRVWVAELITMIFTTLGLTQTSDTGQINPVTVVRGGSTQTAAGYVIGRFNDTAQSTSPLFFKLEFGNGGSTTSPGMWLTLGTGSNGSGVLTGLLTTRTACSSAAAASSTITPCVTAACYSATAGFFGLVWKLGFQATAYQGAGGWAMYRSADNTAAPTTDAVNLLLGVAAGSNGSPSAAGNVQVISYLTNTVYINTAPFVAPSAFQYMPFGVTITAVGSNTQTGMFFQYTPTLGICPWLATVVSSEWGLNATNTETIVGTTAHTYRNVGVVYGSSGGFSSQNLNPASYGQVMLWE